MHKVVRQADDEVIMEDFDFFLIKTTVHFATALPLPKHIMSGLQFQFLLSFLTLLTLVPFRVRIGLVLSDVAQLYSHLFCCCI